MTPLAISPPSSTPEPDMSSIPQDAATVPHSATSQVLTGNTRKHLHTSWNIVMPNPETSNNKINNKMWEMEELQSSKESHYGSMASHSLFYCPVGAVFLPIYLNYGNCYYKTIRWNVFHRGRERTTVSVFITQRPDICYWKQQYPEENLISQGMPVTQETLKGCQLHVSLKSEMFFLTFKEK